MFYRLLYIRFVLVYILALVPVIREVYSVKEKRKMLVPTLGCLILSMKHNGGGF